MRCWSGGGSGTRGAPSRAWTSLHSSAEEASAQNRAKGRLARRRRRGYGRRMTAALLLVASEPELERHLPEDGFRLVPPHGRFDLVLAGDVSDVDRWARHAPVIVLGAAEADVVDCVHAFRRGCDV